VIYPIRLKAMNSRTLIPAAALALIASLAGYRAWTGSHPARPTAPAAQPHAPAPPVAPPGAPPVDEVALKPVSAQTALEINKATPLVKAGPAAAAFAAPAGSTFDRAEQCLTQAIYYEAGNEPTDGKRAVAQVILNRVRSNAFPNSVCGVVYQGSQKQTGCQFTFTCDGALNRVPNPRSWQSAREIAAAALHGYVFAPVGHATHYHANYVVPYWASSMAKVTVIGAHLFYRWQGNWKPATYFGQRYAGAEPTFAPAMLATATQALAALPTALEPPHPDKNGLIPSEGPLAEARAASRSAARTAALQESRGPYADANDADDAPAPESVNPVVALSARLRAGKLKPAEGGK
jgi:spore germination cell wall hydrolase CwlJ-like protein